MSKSSSLVNRTDEDVRRLRDQIPKLLVLPGRFLRIMSNGEVSITQGEHTIGFVAFGHQHPGFLTRCAQPGLLPLVTDA